MRRRLYNFILLLCLLPMAPSLLLAQTYTKLQGFCEDGNVAVTIPGTQGSGIQKFQRSFPSCTVTVYDQGTLNISTIYSTSGGAGQVNPFTAASDGQWGFYAIPANRYDIKFSNGGISISFTRGDWVAPALGSGVIVTPSGNTIPITAYPTQDSYGIGQNVFFFGGNSVGVSNFGVGLNTMETAPTGIENIAIGRAAMNIGDTGDRNIGIGGTALNQNTSGFDNVAIGGSDTMNSNISGYRNVALGPEALYSGIVTNQILEGTFPTINSVYWVAGSGWSLGQTTKASKNADGTGTLTTTSGGAYIDYGAGQTQVIIYTIGDYTSGSVTASFQGVNDTARTANGTYTFNPTVTAYTGPGTLTFTPTNTSRFSVSAISLQVSQAGQGYENTAIGLGALYQNNLGHQNVAIGNGSARQHSTGSDNVYVGVESGVYNNGGQNTFLGRLSGYTNNGSSNTYVGYTAGYTGTTNASDVFIGYQAGYYSTESNVLYIDNQQRPNEANEKVRALIYGTFDASPTNQSVTVNGVVKVQTASGSTITMNSSNGASVAAIGATLPMTLSVGGTEGCRITITPSLLCGLTSAPNETDAVPVFFKGIDLNTSGAANSTYGHLQSSSNGFFIDSLANGSSSGQPIILRPGGMTVMTLSATSGGVELGAPTGGDKGLGTLNVATNIYLNNTAYTNPDFGLEKWATGNIIRFAENPGAAHYPGIMPLEKVEEFAKERFYLPQLDYFHAHDAPAGIKERDDVNLLLHEETFIYLFELNERLKKLERRP